MAAPMPQPKLPRYHSLDSLRGIMMMLGLVLHSSITYLPFIHANANWPYQDAQTHFFFAWLLAFIHLFRMPTFFTVAGFFAAFLLTTRGPKGFLRHRLNRIGVPLVCCWLVIYPVSVVCMRYARTYTAASPPPELDFSPSLMHFWFLYHLLIFCVVAVLITHLIHYVQRPLRERVLRTITGAIPSLRGLILLVAISSFTSYPMQIARFDTITSIFPPLSILAGYGLFFAVGWLVFLRRDILEHFKPRAWGYFAVGFVSHGLFLFFFSQGMIDPANPEKPLMSHSIYDTFRDRGWTDAAEVGTGILLVVCMALAKWFLVYGFLGLFLRYMENPSPSWRYLSDASYWMYIVHPPMAMALPALLADWPVPVGVKFSLVLSAITVITLVTYHYFVRATFIGAQLNGRRYPRVVPWREAATSE